MKERPIIFSAPMVRAILSGAKTQTRRVVPTMVTGGRVEYPGKRDSRGYSRVNWLDTAEGIATAAQECKYGKPGDRLWVRETWGARPHMMGGIQRDTLRYWDDGEYRDEHGAWRWRSPVSMPRWASRITLEITVVRVEALLDISYKDAIAEGVRCGDGRWHRNEMGEAVFMDEHGWYAPGSYVRHNAPKHAFRSAWEAINGHGSWDADPWVWVIEFEMVEAA